MYNELVKRLREHNGWALNETLDQAADAIEELQGKTKVLEKLADHWCNKVPKWIPVTERLPLLNTPVLATDGIEVDISWMYGVPPRWITSYTTIDEDKLTHWIPLPKTPQTLEEDIPIEYFESGGK